MAANLKQYNVDYDVFGLSYYPFWDGTNENMQNVARNIMDKYGKRVMIAETSYAYTTEDGDGFSNSFDGIEGAVDGYAATVQSQATMIRDICADANEVGVIGVFYWEGTWIPVGSRDADNSGLWEKYGSGWASSYSATYDPDDAGLYYGGSSWDNQAMFDFTGHPLASLNVFKYLKDGNAIPLAVDFVPDVNLEFGVGEEIKLPEKVQVVYNDRSANTEVAVSWDQDAVAAIDNTTGGKYSLEGTLDDGTKVPMEDMCQLSERLTEYKYKGSYEQIAKLLKKYSSFSQLDLVNYWEVVIFSWITGNADMHLKNFSLYNNRKMGYALTPAYDLLCTKIVMPEDTEELALTLNGKKRKIQKSDFIKVMKASGLNDKVIANIAKKFRRSIVKWIDLIESSFLPESMKKEYKKQILSRVMALR